MDKSFWKLVGAIVVANLVVGGVSYALAKVTG